jgi:hypothetical protein
MTSFPGDFGRDQAISKIPLRAKSVAATKLGDDRKSSPAVGFRQK